MTLEAKPFNAPLGAEVMGVDLTKPMTPAVANELRAAWLKYQVLVIRGQQISVDDQRRFVNCFGELQQPRGRLSSVNPDILYVANVAVEDQPGDQEGEMHFHADQCYYETPTAGAVLYGMDIPSKGGNTRFANMYMAYETLPAHLRSKLEGRDILFTYDYANNATKRADIDPSKFPNYIHPAVIAHPQTGRPVLFVNRLMAHSIVGLSKSESDQLLDEVFAHIENTGVYEHVWKKHDILLWDNFSTLHARTDFDPSEKRVLRRMGIRGQKPSGYAPN